MMYAFAITVHARPAGASQGQEVEYSGCKMRSLRVNPQELAGTTFACSFETAIERLAKLDRMYAEPDGSFVWTSPQGDGAWQVDGNLYDRDGRLLFVDLKGSCPAQQFDRLLSAFGWPKCSVVVQLTREAVLLEEAEFRRYAQAAAGT